VSGDPVKSKITVPPPRAVTASAVRGSCPASGREDPSTGFSVGTGPTRRPSRPAGCLAAQIAFSPAKRLAGADTEVNKKVDVTVTIYGAGAKPLRWMFRVSGPPCRCLTTGPACYRFAGVPGAKRAGCLSYFTQRAMPAW